MCLCFPSLNTLCICPRDLLCTFFWCPFKVCFLSYGLVHQICGVHVDRCMCVCCVSVTVRVCICVCANLGTVIECAAVGAPSSLSLLSNTLFLCHARFHMLSLSFSLSFSFFQPLSIPYSSLCNGTDTQEALIPAQ